MKLTAKFITAFIFTAIIPLAVLGYLCYGFAKQMLKKQAIEDLALTAEAKEGHLYSFMDAVKGRATDFSSDGFIRDSAEILQRPVMESQSCKRAQKALHIHLTRNKKPLDETIRLISVVDLNGNVIASTNETLIGQNVSESEYFIHGKKGVYISDVFASHNSAADGCTYQIAVAAPLTDKKKGTLLGVIVNFYDTSELNKILSGEFQAEQETHVRGLKRRETLDIYLVNKEKLLITPSKFNRGVMQQKVETLPVSEGAAGREIRGVYKNYFGSEVIGASRYIPSKGWVLLIEISTKEAFRSVVIMRNRILVLVVPVAMVTIFLAHLLSKESRSAVLAEKLRLEALIRDMKEGVILADADDDVILVNSSAEDFFGIRGTYRIGDPLVSCLHDVTKRLAEIPKVFKEGNVEYYASEVVHKERDLEVTASPVIRGSRYLGTIIVVRDITERKQMMVTLQNDRDFISAVLDTTGALVVVLDRQGKIVRFNLTCERITGYSFQEVKDRYLWDLFLVPEELSSVKSVFHGLREGLFPMKHVNYWITRDGDRRLIEWSNTVLLGKDDTVEYVIGTGIDITGRERMESQLRKLSRAVEQSPATVIITGIKGNIEYVNPKFSQLTGYAPEEVIGKNPRILKSGQTPSEEYRRLWDTINSGGEWRGVFCNKKKDGTFYWESATISSIKDPEGIVTNFLAIKEDITELKRITNELRESNERFRLLIESSQDGILAYDKDFRYTLWNKAMERISGVPSEDVLGKVAFEVFPFLECVGEGESFKDAVKGKASVRLAMPYNVIQTDKHGYFDSAHFPLLDANGGIMGGMGIIRESTLRVQSERRLNAQHAVTRVLADSTAVREASSKILQILCEALSWDFGAIWLVDQQSNVLRCMEVWYVPLLQAEGFKAITKQATFQMSVGLPGRVWASGEPAWIVNVTHDPNFPRSSAAAREGLHAAFAFPVMSGDEIRGVVEFFSHEIRQPDDGLLHMTGSIGSQIGQFVMRKEVEDRIRLQLQRVSGLHDVDVAITGSFDLHVSLNVFLDKVVTLLNVDAADVLLLNPPMKTLEYAVGRGFRSNAIQRSCLRIGEGTAGQAVVDRRLISVPDLGKSESVFVRTKLLTDEGFVSHFVVPLIAKGHVSGVLEIFHRSALIPDKEWLEFLGVLSTQGAIVIDNATMFHEIQRSNAELVMAYDCTLEGWSRALELRDEETEGHTQRVTEMTLRLAREMGVGSEDLIHMRRGALLHDIGKMGIPDKILLKPHPLSDEERMIMQRHPTYAFALLSPIAYLKSAIDIPYCHHEKWDGTGYPRGIKGEQIPLAARIFTVIDVWDAMRYDRPYRKGWPEEKVRDHIRSLAGIHFDLDVVKIFLKMKW